MSKLFIGLVLILATTAKLFPPAVTEHYPVGQLTLESVCNLFHFPSTHNLISSGYYFNKILKRLNSNLECSRQLVFNQNLHIALAAVPIKAMKEEAYSINIDAQGVEIGYGGYAGYVYALESLSQLVKDGKLPFAKVQDQPLLQVRGVMIDSARHYLSVASIKRLITSMPLSKLNTLHWHIVDDQSFPLVLTSHPQLAQGGKYSDGQIYTRSDILEIVALAQQNAVQVIPELDTPAHVRSWGLAAPWSTRNSSIKCNGGEGYNGQFDLSVPTVFTMVKDVIKQVEALFTNSPYIHLGGDEVSSNCWDLRPAIKDFMTANNITSYGNLQMYWRSQIKSILPQGRKAVFWRNDGANVTTSADDILQYWGSQADTSKFTNTTTSNIILSPSDILYLNKGQGNIWLNTSAGQYSVWKNIYDNFTVFPAGVNKTRVLGAIACLWGEVSNQDTLENNLWMRATAFAARVWSQTILPTHEVVAGLVKIQYYLYDMKVDASPVSSEFCEHFPAICFPPAADGNSVQALEM